MCFLATVLITKDTSAYIPLAGFILQDILFLMKKSFLTSLCFKLNQRNQVTLLHHVAGQSHSHTIHSPTYMQVRPLIPLAQAFKIMFPLHMILTKSHLLVYPNPLCHLLCPHITCFLMIVITLLLSLLPLYKLFCLLRIMVPRNFPPHKKTMHYQPKHYKLITIQIIPMSNLLMKPLSSMHPFPPIL